MGSDSARTTFLQGEVMTCFIGSIWNSLTQSMNQTPLSLGLTYCCYLLNRIFIQILAPSSWMTCSHLCPTYHLAVWVISHHHNTVQHITTKPQWNTTIKCFFNVHKQAWLANSTVPGQTCLDCSWVYGQLACQPVPYWSRMALPATICVHSKCTVL